MEKKEHTIREKHKITKLAREYKQKGYEVVVSPVEKLLPPSLKEYSPDIMLKKNKQKILIEVKTSETIRKSAYLKDFAEKVNQLEDWQFELVLTNPKIKLFEQKNEILKLTNSEIIKKLNELKSSNEQKSDDDLFANALSVFGIAARNRLKVEQKRIKLSESSAITIKQLYSYGIIDNKSYEWLNSISGAQSQLSYSNKVKVNNIKVLEKLIDLIDEIIKVPK